MAIPSLPVAVGACGRVDRYPSIRRLALAVGVDNSYVARVMRLTLLAPDIVKAILEGAEPDGLSLEQLYRAPAEWEEQRRVLGVTSYRGGI